MDFYVTFMKQARTNSCSCLAFGFLIRNQTQPGMVFEENDGRQGGVMRPNTTRSFCCHLKVKYLLEKHAFIPHMLKQLTRALWFPVHRACFSGLVLSFLCYLTVFTCFVFVWNPNSVNLSCIRAVTKSQRFPFFSFPAPCIVFFGPRSLVGLWI